jgi:hypothetical protein
MSSIVLQPGVKDMLLADCYDFLASEDWSALLTLSPFYRRRILTISQFAGMPSEVRTPRLLIEHANQRTPRYPFPERVSPAWRSGKVGDVIFPTDRRLTFGVQWQDFPHPLSRRRTWS